MIEGPHTTAHALVSMIDNFHYVWLVLGEPSRHVKADGSLAAELARDGALARWARTGFCYRDEREVDALPSGR